MESQQIVSPAPIPHAGRALAACAQDGCAYASRALQVAQPWRTEHPHCALVRRNDQDAEDKPIVLTTLHTPDGRLTQLCTPQGELVRPFVRKRADFALLRAYLGDIDIVADPLFHARQDALRCAQIDRLPGQQLNLYAGGLASCAYADGCEDAASCLRRLTRQLHARLTLSRDLGFTLALLGQPCGEEDATEFTRESDWCRKNLRMRLLAYPAGADEENPAKLLHTGAGLVWALRRTDCGQCPFQNTETPPGLCLCMDA